MPMTPVQVASMKTSMLRARMLWLALCFGMPAALLVGFTFRVLGGHPSPFLAGFGEVPWTNPIVFGLVLLALVSVLAAAVLPESLSRQFKFKDPSIFFRLLVRHFLTCIFLETVAIYGVVLGCLLDPRSASLTLALLLVPMLVGCVIFPNENDWRYRFELENEHS